MPTNQYAVQVGDLQWVRIPPGKSVARPEATRAMKDRTASINKSLTRDTHQQTTVVTHVVRDTNFELENVSYELLVHDFFRKKVPTRNLLRHGLVSHSAVA